MVFTHEDNYKDTWLISFNPGFHDYLTAILNSVVALEMEMATKNHPVLNFYKWCYKYIQELHPHLAKKEVYNIMKGVYDKSYSSNNQVILLFCIPLGNQVLVKR